jgi:hypothetical protein
MRWGWCGWCLAGRVGPWFTLTLCFATPTNCGATGENAGPSTSRCAQDDNLWEFGGWEFWQRLLNFVEVWTVVFGGSFECMGREADPSTSRCALRSG